MQSINWLILVLDYIAFGWAISFFYIEVLPIAFQVNGYSFLREEAKTILLPARGNERIFEFNDVMQLDFLYAEI